VERFTQLPTRSLQARGLAPAPPELVPLLEWTTDALSCEVIGRCHFPPLWLYFNAIGIITGL